MAGIFLRDGCRVSSGRASIVDDLARGAVSSAAMAAIESAEANFGCLPVPTPDGAVPAWDFYCLCIARSGGSCRDGLIGAHIRAAVIAGIEMMSDELRSMIELSCSPGGRRGNGPCLNREILSALILAEVDILARSYGRSVETRERGVRCRRNYQLREKGASPL